MEDINDNIYKLKKYWSKLYKNKKHKYSLKNLKKNTFFYKEAYSLFDKNPLMLSDIEYLMKNVNPEKNNFDYIQKKEFFEILRNIEKSNEFLKYIKHFRKCKKNNINISEFIEIIY